MLSKGDLLLSFSSVEEGFGCFFFQHNLPNRVYEYCLKSTDTNDLLIASENSSDKSFAASVAGQAPGSLTQLHPSIFELAENSYGFTHALAVPNNYHGSLKGALEGKRKKLHLCIPIHRCEFSGGESEFEFKDMIQRLVPAFDWKREICPKIRVYFDNPKVDSGTDEAGVLIKYSTLLSLLEDLDGVMDGFIEITNCLGRVVEVLSPRSGVYTLIHDRKDEESIDFQKLAERILVFVRDV